MKPKQIKLENAETLLIKWDNKESLLSVRYLRDECPCASCKGETILLRTYRPPKPMAKTPEMYKIKNIKTVGGYAIQVFWEDGHDTGIYSWEYLLQLENDQKDNKNQNYQPLL